MNIRKTNLKNSIRTHSLLIVLILSFSFYCIGQETNYNSFKPGELWLDNNNQHINAHGGGFLYHNKTYYWFGEYKGAGKDGSKAFVGVSVYSSKDLYNWKNEGVALRVVKGTLSKLQEGCTLERPKVIYNKKTGKFVMWFHHELKGEKYKAALTGVAVADNITGPYIYLNSFRIHAGILPRNMSQTTFDSIPTINEQQKLSKEIRINQAKNGELFKRDFLGGQMSRDMTLYVDEDDSAYHITASEENQTMLISKLSDDYLSLSGDYIRILPGERNEAPAVLKRNGKYYLFTSGLTGWKPNPARLSVANSMMENWTSLGNPCVGTEDEINTTFWSQSTYIIPVEGKKNAFIFVADRWNGKNLGNSKYIWLPVRFDGEIPYLTWEKEWNLRIFDRK
ncbi:MAG: family 43 glycosylhydrolase [Flavobacteriia bacterium]|nr:family 43 glycosylhydrolase [Flavobacteriia bacterium]OIP48673.1 MAG: beta-glucanase [Flavobacteriaceae bacterium CG2_30_31_66]PIV95555.1 MAG: beta-glucanase [Flavobacteriaceae bacterium CG17_big_fil_post_rev_8_21_14_2_50_31_13]PIX14904.1 MAG: beta-glucanase [Flavobacteriaceae bacterium CG_4_8_14_3_um_filter_31_8]PIY15725.1 MAG: beta-glucanase [Flavobacteriaceae bacterium CG_4_10_14_3_um_filter_31_253]PIZ12044.1 MAG: beta-glucanase [Flavobacteriaceae bacterium CG_4_10_14_0_8_um_filter_31_99